MPRSIDIPALDPEHEPLRSDLQDFAKSGDASRALQQELARSAKLRAVVDNIFSQLVAQMREPVDPPTPEVAGKQFFRALEAVPAQERGLRVQRIAEPVAPALRRAVKENL